MSAEVTAAERAIFRKHVRGLNRLIAAIQKRCPEAGYYLSCGGGSGVLHIMSGSSHEGTQGMARQDRIMESETLDSSDGGDW